MASRKLEWIETEIAALRQQGLHADMFAIESPNSSHVSVNGRRFLNLVANNYLGFSNDPALKQAALDAIQKRGVGPGATRRASGTMDTHVELEDAIARFKGTEAALCFQSGYCANLSVIGSLFGKDDVVFSDALNHASIIDGCRLAGVRVIVYSHCDVENLREHIREAGPYRRGAIITDGVFSMDGTLAPLPELVEVAEAADLMVLVDDAHGEGVLGRAGRGIVNHFGLSDRVEIEIGTLSKALGVVGGYAAGPRQIIDLIIQRARPFIFSTGLTPADAAAGRAALDILSLSGERVERLWENATVLQKGLRDMGFDLGHTQTPITPIMLGDNVLVNNFASALRDKGILVLPVTFPMVARGTARLRLMPSAGHDTDDLRSAIGVFEHIGRKLGAIV